MCREIFLKPRYFKRRRRLPLVTAIKSRRLSQASVFTPGRLRVDFQQKAERITLFSLATPQMRAFHMTWISFFLCFFAWFGIAPLMPIVRAELGLTPSQIKWCIVASVSITIFARLLMGWLCDRIGPRLAYTWLLVLASLPVMGIGLSHDFATFLFFRLMIGAIGASFVITQYHTSIMFAPRCVGTANAAAAGWGNLGGGVTQIVMPLVFALFASVLGLGPAISWRLSMFVSGLICLLAGIAYYFCTQDAPEGNFGELRAAGKLPPFRKSGGNLWEVCRDYRVWALALIYGACFGIELTIDNIAVLYFTDRFGLSVTAAGFAAGTFGLMNIFARALGGVISDRCNAAWGLRGRVGWLFVALLGEGLLLMLFSQAGILPLAICLMLAFGLFVKMSNGATYAVVPFINRPALGTVAGIVGAGGNVGAVIAGMLFGEPEFWPTALLMIGVFVAATSFLALSLRVTPESTTAESPRPRLAFEPALTRALEPAGTE
jgi:MFS transporter, NNP family, nitrate/nitrite transporter